MFKPRVSFLALGALALAALAVVPTFGRADAGAGAESARKANDDPRLAVAGKMYEALGDEDYKAFVDTLATPLRETIAATLASRLASMSPEALRETLEAHDAVRLANVAPTLPELIATVRGWDEQFAEVDAGALATALLKLDADTARPMMAPPPADFEHESVNPRTRGEYAWTDFRIQVEGQMRAAGTHVMMREDGEWRMLSFHQLFGTILSAARGEFVDSPAHFDAYGLRLTLPVLGALAQRAGANADELPAPGENGSTAPLVEAWDEVEAEYAAVVDGEYVDAWGTPLRYEAGAGEEAVAVLRSAGFDGEFGNADDLVETAVADGPARENPRVEMELQVPGSDEPGKVVLELFVDEAPNSAFNFLNLVADGFYDGTKFHRIIEGFMIQGGDPNTRTDEGQPGTGDAGYRLPDEYTGRAFDAAGMLAYANSGPNTSSCQFFITLDETGHLNDNFRGNQRIHYTILGRVVEGMDVVQQVGSVEVRASARGERSVPVEDVVVTKARIVGESTGPYPVARME